MQDHSITLLQVVVAASVALIVVALSHFFSGHRDRENKRREQRIGYLISVFRAFAKANHHPRIYEIGRELEQAVADIQLFGTPEQVRLVRNFAKDLTTKTEAELDLLLIELRNSLRAELKEIPLSSNIVWLRIDKNEDSSSK